jgi:hypothetical protein
MSGWYYRKTILIFIYMKKTITTQITLASVLLTLVIVFNGFFGYSQQVVDDSYYSPPVYKKTSTKKVVYVDQQHNNLHSLAGGYKPFGMVLSQNGFKALPWRKRFTADELKEINVLVICNALSNKNFESWDAPNPSAFDSKEIKALNEWVKEGGALFLIADHMPFAGAAADLAKSFGFTFYNGFAIDDNNKESGDLYVKGKGLQENEITQQVDSIVSFTGSLFDTPPEAKKVLVADQRYTYHLPKRAWVFDANSETMPSAGKCQLAYMPYGKGKVVMSGEAAMFTAQLTGDKKVGMNSPRAKNNYKLLLNLITWLVE